MYTLWYYDYNNNIRCQHVCNRPTTIGCQEDHTFCSKCLDKYYGDNQTKSCPMCRQRELKKEKIKISKQSQRVINSLKMKCALQHKYDISENKDEDKCDWKGDLANLLYHIVNGCPCAIVMCLDCREKMKRVKLN